MSRGSQEVKAQVWKTWDVSSSLTLGTFAVVVQLVECLLAKEKVEGSNPFHRSFIFSSFFDFKVSCNEIRRKKDENIGIFRNIRKNVYRLGKRQKHLGF